MTTPLFYAQGSYKFPFCCLLFLTSSIYIWNDHSFNACDLLYINDQDVYSVMVLPDGRIVSGSNERPNNITVWKADGSGADETLGGHTGVCPEQGLTNFVELFLNEARFLPSYICPGNIHNGHATRRSHCEWLFWLHRANMESRLQRRPRDSSGSHAGSFL